MLLVWSTKTKSVIRLQVKYVGIDERKNKNKQFTLNHVIRY